MQYPWDLLPFDLLKAIDDWQSGSHNKVAKADTLKSVCASLKHVQSMFASCPPEVFRRVQINKKIADSVGVADAVIEDVSAWTTDIDVAFGFKGGIPKYPKTALIYRRVPLSTEVIINLNDVYGHGDGTTLPAAVAYWQTTMGHVFDKGIDKYGASQKEVVLDEHVILGGEIHCFGGHQSILNRVPNIGTQSADGMSDAEAKRTILGNTPGLLVTPSGEWTVYAQASENIRERLRVRVETAINATSFTPI